MRVLVVTNMFPSEEEPQFGSFVNEQIEDLRQLGIDIELLYFDGRKGWTKYATAASTIRRRVAQERFDLVHAHYGLCGAAALAQRRVPVVTTFHGSDFSGHIPWQVWVSRIVARLSTPIFVNVAGAMRLPAGSAVIPAGVDMALFKPMEREDARRQLGWQVDARYVLFPSGPRVEVKRPDLFEAALSEAKADLPELRGVYLEGYSRERVALIMNAVDVTLLTSDWEGSPVTVRESLACQTPVVSVPVGDVSRVLSGLPGCAVVPRDPAALARALLRALGAGRSTELRARAELTARPRTAKRVLGVYEDVLGESRNERRKSGLPLTSGDT
jgi:glycosyltransferase involved in cell wall biosynthesis